ncbi:MAG: phosphate ABC transporter substrate-binding protein [Planctomycetota bacterium]|nr:phosphate ABC transporter substrate-binding protein [Planctomycetota bacterium]
MERERIAVRIGWTSLAGAVLVAAVLSRTSAAEDKKIVVDGSTTVGPIAKAFAEHFMQQNPGVKVTVAESGSGNGAKSLINGTCDVANMSRFMKKEEFKAATERDVFPVAHVVALDGLAVVVHPSNPVKELTRAQVADIYMGKITNWKEVGGPDAKIVVVSRDTNSGTYEAFEDLVMKKQKMAEGVEYVGSNGAVRQRVQTTPGAIGYVGLGFVDETIKALKIDGVEPSKDTVRSGRYPVARPLFMFTNGYPKPGSHVHSFVTLHMTKKGQEMVEAIGFIPVTDYK